MATRCSVEEPHGKGSMMYDCSREISSLGDFIVARLLHADSRCVSARGCGEGEWGVAAVSLGVM